MTFAEAVLNQRTVELLDDGSNNISEDEQFEIAAALQSSAAQVQTLTIWPEFLSTLRAARAIGRGLKANKSVQEVYVLGGSSDNKLASLLFESGFSSQVARVWFDNCRFDQDARKFISQALLHDDSQIKGLWFLFCDWIEVKEILEHGLGQRVEKLGLKNRDRFDVPSLEAILRDSKVQELVLSDNSWIGEERNRADLVALSRCIQSTRISSVNLCFCGISTDGAVVLSEHLLGAENKHLRRIDLHENGRIELQGYEALLNQGLARDTTVLEVLLDDRYVSAELHLRINQICRANKALGFFFDSSLWDGERRRCRSEWPFFVAQIAKHPAALHKLLRGLLPVEDLLQDCPITMRQRRRR